MTVTILYSNSNRHMPLNCRLPRCKRTKVDNMPRPKKWRQVCRMPGNDRFGPLMREQAGPTVILPVDEYETIRLIDLEGLTQEECAVRMNIARTTVQSMYDQARRKLADALVNGKDLHIQGGSYILCEQRGNACMNGACSRIGRGGNPGPSGGGRRAGRPGARWLREVPVPDGKVPE